MDTDQQRESSQGTSDQLNTFQTTEQAHKDGVTVLEGGRVSKSIFDKFGKYLMIGLALIMGGVGLYTLRGSFANESLMNGFVYTGGGHFMDPVTKTIESTVGYQSEINDDALFSYKGDKVAYLSVGAKDVASLSTPINIEVSNSDGSGEIIAYKGTSTSSVTPDSVSWSRDGQWLTFLASDLTSNQASGKIMMVRSDGSASKEVSQQGLGDQGSVDSITLSSENNDVLYVVKGNSVCTVTLSSSATSCVPIVHKDQPFDLYRDSIAGYKMISRGPNLYIKWNHDGPLGSNMMSINIARINASDGSIVTLTDFPEQLFDISKSTVATDSRDVRSYTVSPDGSQLIYHTSLFHYEAAASSSSDVREDALFNIALATNQNTIFYDNMGKNLKLGNVSWQPYLAGNERPAIPKPLSSMAPIVSMEPLVSQPVIGQEMAPSIAIKNPNLTKRSYNITAIARVNGQLTTLPSQQITVEGQQVGVAKGSVVKVPYAAAGAFTIDNLNSYDATVSDAMISEVSPNVSMTFNLPMIPFTMTSPGATVTKAKGRLITFAGTTLPGKTVRLYTATKTKVLASGQAGATGIYSFTFKADVSRTPQLCVLGYETVPSGCFAIKIIVK